MNNLKKEKAVSSIHFRMMTFIMSIVKNIRDIKSEILNSGIKKGNTVLDYGCGPGYTTVIASKIAGPNGMVYALDIHPLSIKIIEKKIKKNSLENVKTMLAGTRKLEDECIDVVLLFNVIFMVNNKKKIIDELYRILKKDGTISVVNSGLASKFNKKQVSEENLTQMFCGKNKFFLSQKIRNNYNFKKQFHPH